jgi:hypothetical protein
VSLSRAFITAAVVLALCSEGRSDPAPKIHYAPGENLEHIDVALVDTAQHEIDMAAYVLTDWPVIQALTRRRPSNAISRRSSLKAKHCRLTTRNRSIGLACYMPAFQGGRSDRGHHAPRERFAKMRVSI